MRATALVIGLLLLATPSLAQSEQPASSPPADSAAPPPASDSTVPAPAPGGQTTPDQATPPPPPAAAALTNPPMTGPKLLISTAMGDITLQLDAQRAPKSVANVLRYVREKHYDGTVVYRVVKGFVIQMGSFAAHNKGRGVRPGPVKLEAGNGLRNLRGAVALAHGDDPDSATADFFINVADNPPLDKSDSSVGYAVFGQVVDGMDVVDKIDQVAVGDDGPMKGQAPMDPILIKKISIIGEPNAPTKQAAKKKSK
ncbi:MAG TPA: peptidylprolyl isomerase [Rhizomicrobium sp.]|jgi:cyclophilin family peptidyl-prolyl cis-trans isomerase|nr:peptidylprolyl isomerase [Rhizomicrobium sp.]